MIKSTNLTVSVDNGSTIRVVDEHNFARPAEELHMESIFRVILIIQGTASSFLNITVIAVYFRMGNPRKKFPNYMLLCAAFSDLLICALTWIAYVLSAINDSGDEILFDRMSLTNIALIEYSLSLCLGTLFLSALDRMLSVINPLRHRNMMMKRNVKCVTLIVWMVSAIPPFIRLGMADFKMDNLYNDKGRIYNYVYRSILMMFIFVVIVILAITCIRVSQVIRNPMNTVSTKKKSDDGSQMSVHKRNRRVIKIFIGMIVAFSVSFLPITFVMFLHDAKKLNLKHLQLLKLIVSCDVLYLASSVVNPLITLTLKEDYRRVFMRMFRRKNSLGYRGRSQENKRSNFTASTNL